MALQVDTDVVLLSITLDNPTPNVHVCPTSEHATEVRAYSVIGHLGRAAGSTTFSASRLWEYWESMVFVHQASPSCVKIHGRTFDLDILFRFSIIELQDCEGGPYSSGVGYIKMLGFLTIPYHVKGLSV